MNEDKSVYDLMRQALDEKDALDNKFTKAGATRLRVLLSSIKNGITDERKAILAKVKG